ncbi:uncharacterized protein T551_02971 [Pneumocystis jirovecii RU7]|uniref:ZW10 C-terminal helical domain-containing protein n=1 Tax=Pneumocystis jirovecii (strain RU7) TaxID=1408657 RepID=A0A0W4ZGG4_PNEJ7|nr:uncharacterized protein T551_02971 [Pneumocystis jirovecii RU7]KTW27472.1 hypothetical protein T551_02971 [Pneumocystis jirovecii RU7]
MDGICISKNMHAISNEKPEIIDTMILHSVLDDSKSLEKLSKQEMPLEAVLQKVESEINKTREILLDLILKNQKLFLRILNQKVDFFQKIERLVSNSVILSEVSVNNQKNSRILQENSEKLEELKDSIKLKRDLKDTILKLKSIISLTNKAENLITQGNLFEAFHIIKEAENEYDNINELEKIEILVSFREKLTNLKLSLIKKFNNIWDSFIMFENGCIVKKQLKDSFEKSISLTSFIELSIELKIFDSRMQLISNNFMSKFLFLFLNKEIFYTLEFNENNDEYQLIIKSDVSNKNDSIFSSLLVLINFIDKAFPSIVLLDLTKYLFPKIQSALTKDYINIIVPDEIEYLDYFNKVLLEGSRFNDKIKQTVWGNQLEIKKWIDLACDSWVLKQKSNAIDAVRNVLGSKNSGNIIIQPIQNIETKVLQNENVDSIDDNEWDANWDNDDKYINDEKNMVMVENDTWGLNDDMNIKSENSSLKEELWNWDDNDDWNVDAKESNDAKDVKNSEKKSSLSESSTHESYTISFLPKEIILIVEKCIYTIKELMSTQYANYIMAPFFPQLSDSIIMALSTYRALAPLYYDKLSTSAMLLYNDFIYLSIHLQELYDGSEVLQCILDETNTLREAGNLIYSSELQIQNNDIISILEQANGFLDCTDKQQLERCIRVISDLYEKFQMLSKLWSKILPRETFFESIGQLLETAVAYIIIAIKNISDISEAESKQLSELCNQFAQVEDIFVIEEQELPITPTYVPSWLKFRYLAEILEASMQDVMYLYNSGALIDFDKEEIISLLKTLFAETPCRAENISKIRNS